MCMHFAIYLVSITVQIIPGQDLQHSTGDHLTVKCYKFVHFYNLKYSVLPYRQRHSFIDKWISLEWFTECSNTVVAARVKSHFLFKNQDISHKMPCDVFSQRGSESN